MKKIWFWLVAVVCIMAVSACEDDKIITVEELPAAAQTYIQKNYATVPVTYAKKDSELFSTTYKVRLDNGLEIEFDGDGTPIDMDTDD